MRNIADRLQIYGLQCTFIGSIIAFFEICKLGLLCRHLITIGCIPMPVSEDS